MELINANQTIFSLVDPHFYGEMAKTAEGCANENFIRHVKKFIHILKSHNINNSTYNEDLQYTNMKFQNEIEDKLYSTIEIKSFIWALVNFIYYHILGPYFMLIFRTEIFIRK